LADKNASKNISVESLRAYYDLMVAQNLLELEVKEDDFSLKLVRRNKQAPVMVAGSPAQESDSAASAQPDAPSADQNQLHSVASPLSGTFYRAASPGADPYVKEGDKVSLGTLLCIVEAMKVMNEIRADRPYTIRKILIENGKPVNAGQNLFLVDPLS
jgi:acetyl-CoA carboxylase biotin carboxyl carrier protein